MKPKYAANLVVAIKNSGRIEWYVLDKEMCYLDYEKWEQAIIDAGYAVYSDPSERFGVRIVNEASKETFLEGIKPFRIDTDALRKMFQAETDKDEKLSYNASVMIDFDDRKFFSQYVEPEPFELYVPDGWEGIYQDFDSLIPQNQRYWLDSDGKNIF